MLSTRAAGFWAADRNVVYFCGARGQRYAKLRIRNRLDLAAIRVYSTLS
jgi:hypothetical protein